MYVTSAAVATELLEHGALVDALDEEDTTPLHHAAELTHAALVAAMLRCRADVSAADQLEDPLLTKAAKGEYK